MTMGSTSLPLPELLPGLLRRLARDPVPAVRAAVLQGLPYLLHRQPALGWQLLGDAFREPQTDLWRHAERTLYYQIRDQFAQVRPCLDRIRTEAIDNAGETWGRLSALACLEGHLPLASLLESLPSLPGSAWKGVAAVFAANLDKRDMIAVCQEGLLGLLAAAGLPDEIMPEIEGCFEGGSQGAVSQALALAFVRALPSRDRGQNLSHFLEWLARHARHDPDSALVIAEKLAERLAAVAQPLMLWPPKPLMAALVEILREADQMDDADRIRRAIALQDRFLALDVHGMEELLDQAARHS
ncbi:MAG: hypothetical protein AB1634_15575 [Thermodesulfobacteriota bacterium]